jgi:hypothetical protein
MLMLVEYGFLYAKCLSPAFDAGFELLVHNDPCVRVLCCAGVLVALNVLWVLCMYGMWSAYSHAILLPFLHSFRSNWNVLRPPLSSACRCAF